VANYYLAFGMFVGLFVLMAFAAYEAVTEELSNRRK
jgi:hypothetical protein